VISTAAGRAARNARKCKEFHRWMSDKKENRRQEGQWDDKSCKNTSLV